MNLKSLSGLPVLFWALVMPSWADSSAGRFNVNISLQPVATGLCISEALSEQTNSVVTVTCRDREFVSIEARPARGMVFAHGGAQRYVFRHNNHLAALRSEESVFGINSGTVTSLRVFRVQGQDDWLELLVSF